MNISTSLPLYVEPIPAFRDNYIWLLRRGQSAVVVDPGAAEPVEEVLAREGLCLAAILVTHHHADHQGGIAALARHWQPTVYGPRAESITGLTHPLSGGETIDLKELGIHVKVMHVPGHTLGHLAYFFPGYLFCGDTLFGAGCGRLFEGTPQMMYASLAEIAALPDETRIFCAHEYTEVNLRFAANVEPDNPNIPARTAQVAALREAGKPSLPSSLADEKATNPFLRCCEAGLIAAARSHGALSDAPEEVFAAIRAWRNDF